MREILFRGKRIYDGAWVEGNLIVDENGKKHIITHDVIEEDGHHLRIDSDLPVFFEQDTIGQYTGLTDKNGKKIFEGDIVKVEHDINETFSRGSIEQNSLEVWDEVVDTVDITEVVSFINGSFTVAEWDLGWFKLYEIEVIGNIHDNPELLKEEQS